MRITLPTPVTLTLLLSLEGIALAQAPTPSAPSTPAPAPNAPAPSAQTPAGARPGSASGSDTVISPVSGLPTSEPVTKASTDARLSGDDAALKAQAHASAAALPASEADAGVSTRVPIDPAERSGFTAGLRLGLGVPVGKAGDSALGAQRDLGDLTPWSVPVWVDVAYAFTGRMTLGAYGQVGIGGTGDACQGDCEWSSIRVGAEAELRFAPGAPVDPWLGVGVGYEWLTFRALQDVDVTDAMGATTTVPLRATERLGGPELTIQGGLDFQAEDALRLGPYIAASAGPYLTDSYTCEPVSALCPSGNSVDGGAFHSWLSVGLRGAYTP
jgi:hypothetical protein